MFTESFNALMSMVVFIVRLWLKLRDIHLTNGLVAKKPSAPSKKHDTCSAVTRLPQTNCSTASQRTQSDRCDFMKTEHQFTFLDICFTCDVVEVVEAVEVQAAGLAVRCVRTLSPDSGRSQGVRCPHTTVGSGTRLKQRQRMLMKTLK